MCDARKQLLPLIHDFIVWERFGHAQPKRWCTAPGQALVDCKPGTCVNNCTFIIQGSPALALLKSLVHVMSDSRLVRQRARGIAVSTCISVCLKSIVGSGGTDTWIRHNFWHMKPHLMKIPHYLSANYGLRWRSLWLSAEKVVNAVCRLIFAVSMDYLLLHGVVS